MGSFCISSWALFPYWGLAAFVVFVCACLPPAISYRGRAGQRYHTFNHFISELGEEGISRHAGVFNYLLILTGGLMAGFFVQFGRSFNSPAGWCVAALGALMAAFCMMVGVTPMNKLRPHMAWACLTFMGGAAVFIAAGIAIALDGLGRLPIVFAVFSFIVAGIYATFLTIPILLEKKMAFEPIQGERPKLWYLPMMEWGTILATMVLVAVICLYALF